MECTIECRPKAIKELEEFPTLQTKRIVSKIDLLKVNLSGDVKKLKGTQRDYGLRVGDYRVIIEIEKANRIITRTIKYRKEACNELDYTCNFIRK